MALGARSAALTPEGIARQEIIMSEPISNSHSFEELAEMMRQDSDLMKGPAPVNVPHTDLPGARLGGGAANEANSKAAAIIPLLLVEEPSERRKYNRRLSDRRDAADFPVDSERRLIQRRIWLRREEDRKGKVLLNVTDAANTLGVTIEQLYKWLDNSDIPFYQVTEGKRKAIRFEVNELLHWHSQFVRKSTNI
jgi:hypothetical protein